MPVPSFNANGLLPAFMGVDAVTHDRSPYVVSMAEVIPALGRTPERRQLLRNLLKYRALLARAGFVDGIQFVDGSFVEFVELIKSRPPNDIDVFTLVHIPSRYLDDDALWISEGLPFWSAEVIDQARNKERFSLDTYAIIIDDLRPWDLIKLTMYWHGLFSHQRDTFAWKGFAAVPLDPAGDEAALLLLDAA